ncbi:hypothetical protein HCH_02082 [Hahella chejuensis KCTC 2396]|uniref:Uncharacterized protein n=1 Tax=Hahella chejuensis (strain KCTC 2396) TaxID=349521 RepID=Q2SKB1_HAHCH|nr:hypothetical protein HCH_02082 [Hahella chejuensis KCTC 2396]
MSRDYQRLSAVLAGFHFIAFVCLMLPTAMKALAASGCL